MTLSPEEIKQFNDFGCASRCIIYLSTELHKKPITREEFIEKFRGYYTALWKKNLGLLPTSEIIRICQVLNLGNSASAIRAYDQAHEALEDSSTMGLFLLTDRDWTTGTKVNFHVSLVRGYEAGAWQLWTPLSSGEDKDMAVTTEFLELAKSHFLVLQ